MAATRFSFDVIPSAARDLLFGICKRDPSLRSG